MTFAEESPVFEQPSVWSDSRRRYLQKRYLCSWILAVVFPFVLLRLVFMSEVTFPFLFTSNSSVSLPSEYQILHLQSPAPSPEIQLETGSDSPPFIRPDEDAWVTHDDWINHDLNPPDDRLKEDDEKNPRGNNNSTEVMETSSSTTSKGENSGLDDDIEKEELELEASEMTRKDEKSTNDDSTAADETISREKDNSGAGDPFKAENTQQEDFKEEEIHTDENRGVQSQERADKEPEATESSSTHEKMVDDRQAEEKNNFEEAERKRQDAKDKQPTGNFEEKDNGEHPKFEVTKQFEKQDNAQEKVNEEEEKSHQNSDRANETNSKGQCDLFEGQWEHDPEGPLYTNATCFFIQEAQNCMSNGRPDSEYINWRWKPRDCDLPRFNAKSFLDSFRGRAIGFIGDSIARNQMQSLLCLLSQVEIPVKTYVSADDQTVRWLFVEHQVTLAVVWSSYLLKESHEGIMGFEKGQSVLFLDELDTSWTSVMTDFDLIVLLTGQWYYKSSVYVNRGEVVGCHYCPGLNLTDIGFYQAYRKGIRQVLEKVSNEFKGIALMSTFPLSHFENGTWDTGGFCQRKLPLELLQSKSFPGDHNQMHDIVMNEFESVISENRDLKKDARLEILDVTRVALQRADGHPGPFRRPHPFEDRDPNVYYPNDCLHWCLPGPIETWNQLMVRIVEKYL